MSRYQVMQIKEIISRLGRDGIFDDKVACHLADENNPIENLLACTYLDAFCFTLILSGTAQISINFHKHSIGKNNLLFLSPLSLISYDKVSNDFFYIDITVNRNFLNELPLFSKTYTHAYFAIKYFKEPILKLDSKSCHKLKKQMLIVRDRILQTNHTLQREVIKNALVGFMLDLDDILTTDFNDSRPLSRQENILKSFIELLPQYYKEKHNVAFFANSLSITPQYLSLIVKQNTGLSVNALVFDMLFSEARILLQDQNLTLQQIAEMLKFSDQSSFGKFFKRKSGLSPLQYRRVSLT